MRIILVFSLFFLSSITTAQDEFKISTCDLFEEEIEKRFCITNQIERGLFKYLEEQKVNLDLENIYTNSLRIDIEINDGVLTLKDLNTKDKSFARVAQDFFNTVVLDKDFSDYSETIFYQQITTITDDGQFKPNFKTLEEARENSAFNFEDLDIVPKYPGCKGKDRERLVSCLSGKIAKHVGENFNTGLGSYPSISKGIQRIYVKFVITADGTIDKIEVRNPYIVLKNEARRVMNLLPKIQPGVINDQAVNVAYALPIVFKVE